PSEVLEVEADELARRAGLVAPRLLEPEPTQPAHAEPAQDRRDGRGRHHEQLRDLGSSHPQHTQSGNRLQPLRRRAVRDPPRRRRTIAQTPLTLDSIAAHPLARTAHTHARGGRRRRHRPPLNEHTPCEPPSTAPTERRVTVKLHPGPPLD